jgi:hypothetical protein
MKPVELSEGVLGKIEPNVSRTRTTSLPTLAA